MGSQPHMHPDEATGKLSTTPASHLPQSPHAMTETPETRKKDWKWETGTGRQS